jgi:hypothetical protein
VIPDAVAVCTTGAASETLPTVMVPLDTAVEAPALLGSVNICSTGSETLPAGMLSPDAVVEASVAESTPLLGNANICPEGPATEAPLLMSIFSSDVADEGLSLVGISDVLSKGITEGTDNSISKNSNIFGFGTGGMFSFPEDSYEQLPSSLDGRFSSATGAAAALEDLESAFKSTELSEL